MTTNKKPCNELNNNMEPAKKKKKCNNIRDLFEKLELKDLSEITTLGIGAFGHVTLVQVKHEPHRSFALKRIAKSKILTSKQQNNVLNEKKIMQEADSDFIVRLFKTFRDERYVYMLMESCLGGDMWSLLRIRKYFNDETARFYTACVIEAFNYLHSRNIVYHDLKPENMVIDSRGYVKLADFGFAKKLAPDSKIYSFCGTLQYMSPEVIQQHGHDIAVDYWSLGILIYELVSGTAPFHNAEDNVETEKVYQTILKGLDDVPFPTSISGKAKSLIQELCCLDPNDRLGYQRGGMDDIRKHKWFDKFYWWGLQHRILEPPIKPVVRSAIDSANFDKYPSEPEDPPPNNNSDWDKDF